MTNLAIVAVLALAVIGVVADAMLKLASKEPTPFVNVWFFLGMGIFAATAFGWTWAMQNVKLGVLGAVYGTGTILLLVIVGLLFFGEKLTGREIAGICCAIAAILLLVKFS